MMRKTDLQAVIRWALTNPHLSLLIASEDRITISTQRKRNGHLKRPSHGIASILSNVHLLLRVPSFARWPLKLHFFNEEVYTEFVKYCATPDLEPLRQTLDIITDFAPNAVEALMATKTSAKLLDKSWSNDEDLADEEVDEEEPDAKPASPTWGIHALPLDHYPLAPYLEKGQNIINFGRQGSCVVCRLELDHEKGLYAICSEGECEGVGHLDCWSRHLLHLQGGGSEDDMLLPMNGRCPKCDGAVRWGDMMKELTLRTRGLKQVEKILRKHTRATRVTKPKAQVAAKKKSPAKAKSSFKVESTSEVNKTSSRAKGSAKAKSPARVKKQAQGTSDAG